MNFNTKIIEAFSRDFKRKLYLRVMFSIKKYLKNLVKETI